jgi:CheY-like chemotaxis protein
MAWGSGSVAASDGDGIGQRDRVVHRVAPQVDIVGQVQSGAGNGVGGEGVVQQPEVPIPLDLYPTALVGNDDVVGEHVGAGEDLQPSIVAGRADFDLLPNCRFVLNGFLSQKLNETACERSRLVKIKFVFLSDDGARTLWHDRGTMNKRLTSGNGKEGNMRPVRVLIADDQRPTRQALAALLTLSPQPVNVVGEAADGETALRLVEELRPDVVIVDVQMPGLDGLETTEQIKRRWPEVRVVMLTMYAGYQARARAAGADAFLLKGGSVEALQSAVTLEPNATARRQTIWRREEASQTQLEDQQQKE